MKANTLESIQNRIGKSNVSSLLPSLKIIANEWKLNLYKQNDFEVAKRIVIDNDYRLLNEHKVNLN